MGFLYPTYQSGDVLVTEFYIGPVCYQHYSLATDKRCEKGLNMLISASKRTSTVKEEPYDVVTQGNKTYPISVNSLLPASELVEKAREYIDVWKYSVSERNCEHFINLITGGKLSSSQVNSAILGGF